MTFSDIFIPKTPLRCPACFTFQTVWSASFADAACLVWQEGQASPIEQRMPADVCVSAGELKAFRLQGSLEIRGESCGHHPAARAQVDNGVWRSTVLVEDAPVIAGSRARLWRFLQQNDALHRAERRVTTADARYLIDELRHPGQIYSAIQLYNALSSVFRQRYVAKEQAIDVFTLYCEHPFAAVRTQAALMLATLLANDEVGAWADQRIGAAVELGVSETSSAAIEAHRRRARPGPAP